LLQRLRPLRVELEPKRLQQVKVLVFNARPPR
jgi:hypothetical protein